jgi:hypothetical protein
MPEGRWDGSFAVNYSSHEVEGKKAGSSSTMSTAEKGGSGGVMSLGSTHLPAVNCSSSHEVKGDEAGSTTVSTADKGVVDRLCSTPLPAGLCSTPLPAGLCSTPLPAALCSTPLAAGLYSTPLPAALCSPKNEACLLPEMMNPMNIRFKALKKVDRTYSLLKNSRALQMYRRKLRKSTMQKEGNGKEKADGSWQWHQIQVQGSSGQK